MLRKHLAEMNIQPKTFTTTFLLLFNTFTWFYMTLAMINNLMQTLNMASEIWIFYYTAIVLSGIAGSILSRKTQRHNFLYFWMAFGTAMSISPVLIKGATIVPVSITGLLLGASVGLGMPSALAFFADHTLVENRGRIGGIIFLATNLGAFPLAIPFMFLDLTSNSLILAAWRGLGLFLFFLLKPEDSDPRTSGSQRTVTSNLYDRSFMLYLIPWIMFVFIDRFGAQFPPGRQLVEAVIASFSAFIGGLLADYIGRKRVVVYGFILLGIAYGIIGIAPAMTASLYIYMVFDGLAAGILWVTCILILWGDLSQPGTREKYYVIGNSPFFLTNLVPIFLSPYIALIPVNAVFSLASFFLFSAVLPLIYAPETLPEKKIELRRVKGYVEQAKKVRDKYLRKRNAAES